MPNQTHNVRTGALLAYSAEGGLCLTIVSIVLLASLSGLNEINIIVTSVFVGLVFVNLLIGRRTLWLSPEMILFSVWLGVSCVSLLVARDSDAAWFKTLTLLQIGVFAFAAQQVVVWRGTIRPFVWVFAIALIASYLLAYSETTAFELAKMDVEGEHGEDLARIASTLGNANMFGVSCCMALCLLWVDRKASNAVWGFTPRLALTVICTLLIVAALHSGSRTALLGLLVVMIGYVVLEQLYRPRILLGHLYSVIPAVFVLGGLLLLASGSVAFQDKAGALLVDNERVISRIHHLIAVFSGADALSSEDGSISSRTQMIVSGLKLIAQHPMFGIGLDNFRSASGADTYSHSNPIEVVVSTGIVGGVLYFGIYAVLLLRLFRIRRRATSRAPASAMICSVLAFMLMDITHISFSEKTSWLFLALMSALSCVLLKRGVRRSRRSTSARSEFAQMLRSTEIYKRKASDLHGVEPSGPDMPPTGVRSQ